MRAAWFGLVTIALGASCMFLWNESEPPGEGDDSPATVAALPLLVVSPPVAGPATVAQRGTAEGTIP